VANSFLEKKDFKFNTRVLLYTKIFMEFTKLYQSVKNLLSKEPPQIEIFVRHCHFSNVSSHKKRPEGFSREKCHLNLMATLENEKNVNVTFFLDTFYPMEKRHFILDQNNYPVIQIKEGNEGGSFCKMLDHVLSRSFSSDTIIYFLEDDYLHRPDWVSVMREGIAIPEIDYLTLYDHRDKYFHPNYKGLKSELFLTESTHWRVTPSTTNTYAMKFKTLKRDQDLHFAFSKDKKISEDHAKFCALSDKGSKLISPIPGWSCHMEPEFASPCIDWQAVQEFSVN